MSDHPPRSFSRPAERDDGQPANATALRLLGYCDHWKRRYAEPGPPLTEPEARARHDAGEPYGALLAPEGGPDRPTVAVQVSTGTARVDVSFLDDHLRTEGTYVFTGPAGTGAL